MRDPGRGNERRARSLPSPIPHPRSPIPASVKLLSAEFVTSAAAGALRQAQGKAAVAGIPRDGVPPFDGLRAALSRIDGPQVALAGRSNVGKSSLINALVGRHALARVSNAPGRTRELNFFELGRRLMLVDLPGYGHAKAPKAEIARWTRLTLAYLGGRAQLRRVCLLIDARHGVKDADRRLMAMLDEAAVGYQAVLTKCDKVTGAELAARLGETAAELARRPAAHPHVVATSAQGGRGLPELRATLAALAAPRSSP